MGHYDGYDAYALKCGRCGRVYEMPSELPLKLVDHTIYVPVAIEPDEARGANPVPEKGARMKEVCSCTAEKEITDVSQWSTEALLEVFREWRENHRHEFQPEVEVPTVVESGSSHERLGEFYGAEDRVPIGFARNC